MNMLRTLLAVPILVRFLREVWSVLIEGEAPRCLAHELGHACGLWHHRSSENVMSSTCGGTKL